MIHVVTTHLGLWADERSRQATKLLEGLHVSRRVDDSLGGDLNEWHWGKSLGCSARCWGARLTDLPHGLASCWRWIGILGLPPRALFLREVHTHQSRQSRTAPDHLQAEIRFESKKRHRVW